MSGSQPRTQCDRSALSANRQKRLASSRECGARGNKPRAQWTDVCLAPAGVPGAQPLAARVSRSETHQCASPLSSTFTVLHDSSLRQVSGVFNPFHARIGENSHLHRVQTSMATRQEIQAKLAAIDQKKADALKALQVKRAKLKAARAARTAYQIPAPLGCPPQNPRRCLHLGKLEHAGLSPQALTFDDKRFFDWLIRPNDRAVFETPPPGTPAPETRAANAPHLATTDTPLNVPFDDKDQAKALGAHWNPEKKVWFVPAGRELAPFTAWLGSP